jgi:hypothetical protein
MALIPDRLASGVVAAALCAMLIAPLAARAQQGSPTTTAPATQAPTMAAPAPSTAASSRQSRIDAYINNMHKRLKVTSEQETQWNAVAQVMRDNAEDIDKLASDRRAKRSSMTAVDDLQSYEAIADAHADGLKKLVPAFSALYDSMSDTQKKNADQVFGHRTARASHAKKSG